MKRLYEYKYIKPLEARKVEHDAKRKELRLLWERQVRQVVRNVSVPLQYNNQEFPLQYKKKLETFPTHFKELEKIPQTFA